MSMCHRVCACVCPHAFQRRDLVRQDERSPTQTRHHTPVSALHRHATLRDEIHSRSFCGFYGTHTSTRIHAELMDQEPLKATSVSVKRVLEDCGCRIRFAPAPTAGHFPGCVQGVYVCVLPTRFHVQEPSQSRYV